MNCSSLSLYHVEGLASQTNPIVYRAELDPLPISPTERVKVVGRKRGLARYAHMHAFVFYLRSRLAKFASRN